MTFPRKPLFDRLIIRETPLADIYHGSDLELPLDDSRRKDRSDRGVVVAAGDSVVMGGVVLPMPVKVGDVVFFDEYTLSDPVYLNPADKHRSDLPKYWQIRVQDLKGIEVFTGPWSLRCGTCNTDVSKEHPCPHYTEEGELKAHIEAHRA